MGVITPVGNDVETFWNNIISGVNGIAPITRFDTTDYAVKIGAEVKDFDPTKYMEKSEVRRSDHNVHMAVAAAAQAVEDSGIEGNFDPERAAVYFGSAGPAVRIRMRIRHERHRRSTASDKTRICRCCHHRRN